MIWIASLVAGAVFAAPVAGQSTPSTKTAQPEEKLVCRLINTTGSRLGGERVCKTRAQWDAESDQAREDVENTPWQPSGDQFTPNDPN